MDTPLILGRGIDNSDYFMTGSRKSRAARRSRGDSVSYPQARRRRSSIWICRPVTWSG